MKPWKKTRKAWEWTLDIKPKGKAKKIVTRIERSKLKKDAQKELDTQWNYDE